MAILRILPYLLSAVLLAAGGYLAGAVTDPFRPATTQIRGELDSEAPRLREELKAARGKAAELTGELERAQTTIDRLRGELEGTRTRIAGLQRRAEAAEQAQADAEARIAELAERVAALEARAAAAETEAGSPAEAPATAAETGETTADAPAAGRTDAMETAAAGEPAGGEPVGGNGPETDAPGRTDAERPQTDAGDGDAGDGDGGSGNSGTGDRRAADAAAAETAQADAADDGRALAPGAAALEPIDPTTRQANRLEGGVESYQQGDYRGAFEAWLPLAQAGYARAQLHLGALFLEGRGVERDDALAHAWLTIAQDNGSRNARGLLNTLQQRMDEAELTRARRLVAQAGGETPARAN